MREIFYSVKTKGTSSKKLCNSINEVPSNQGSTTCLEYEGGGIGIKSTEDPIALKKKIERIFDIKLGEPQYEQK